LNFVKGVEEVGANRNPVIQVIVERQKKCFVKIFLKTRKAK